MALEIVFWDVQHGDAVYIKTPNNTHIVRDLGTGSYGSNDSQFSPLVYLKSRGIAQLDYVIISHPHKDHIDDIMNFDIVDPRVLTRPKSIPKDVILEGVREEDRHLFEKYLEIDQRYNRPVSSEENPSLPQNNGGVTILNFFPELLSTSNINNYSVVTVLSYANLKVILAGDNEPPSWEKLLEKDDFVEAIEDADIFFAPHHGRESGYYSELFEYFKPKLTIVSDGRFCDTSATDRYSQVSSGWTVHHRDGSREKRYCLTTRSDGVIVVELGYTLDRKSNFIKVTID
jgi:competence protein ComEC